MNNIILEISDELSTMSREARDRGYLGWEEINNSCIKMMTLLIKIYEIDLKKEVIVID